MGLKLMRGNCSSVYGALNCSTAYGAIVY
jgi:hypothetical protein